MEDAGVDQTDGRYLAAERFGDLQQMIGGTRVGVDAVFVAVQRLQNAALKIQPGFSVVRQFAAAERVHLAQQRMDEANDGGEVVLSSRPELKVRHIRFPR